MQCNKMYVTKIDHQNFSSFVDNELSGRKKSGGSCNNNIFSAKICIQLNSLLFPVCRPPRTRHTRLFWANLCFKTESFLYLIVFHQTQKNKNTCFFMGKTTTHALTHMHTFLGEKNVKSIQQKISPHVSLCASFSAKVGVCNTHYACMDFHANTLAFP